jgi:hypothetical protein
VDEHIPYEKFSRNMKKLNDEQTLIVDDIIYIKNTNIFQKIHIFFYRRCKNNFFFTSMCIIQNMLRYNIKDIINTDL